VGLAESLSLKAPPGQRVAASLRADLERHFEPPERMELAMTIAVLVGMAKMLFAFDWGEREGACPFGE
jgi:hypothetical protein